MMNIVQVAVGKYPLPIKGIGGENITFNLANALGEIPNCKVSMIDLKAQFHKGLDTKFKFEEVFNHNLKGELSIIHALRLALYSCFMSLRLIALNSKNKIDIVHLHNQLPASFVILVKRLFRLKFKIVYTLHNALVTMPGFNINKLLEKPVLKNADMIIAMTPSIKKYLIEQFAIPEHKIAQIYLGIDTGQINKVNNEGIKKIPDSIIYTSRICGRKNQMALVKAMVQVLKQAPGAQCFLTGSIDEKEYFEEIMDFAKERSISASIKYC